MLPRLQSSDAGRNGNRGELLFNTSGTSGNAIVQNAGGHIINGDYTVHQTASTRDEDRKIEQKRDVLEWIYTADSDTSPNYNAAKKVHLSGTGTWFLDGSQFSEWKEQPGAVLWLYGGPGSGKTVLSSTVIANIIDFCDLTPLARGYAYFFFDARNDLEQPELVVHNTLTRSLITQLADRCGDEIPAALANMYRACDNGHRQPSDSILEDTLLQLIECFEDVYIVVDSLDECADRETLLKWIQSITSKASGKLHLMLTSRSESAIERGLASLSGLRRVWIGDQLTAGDIRAYVNAEVAKMDRWNKPGERDMIEKALLDGSDGMFRWVALQAQDLGKCKSKKELINQLGSLPKGLDGTYARIFERSENRDVLKTFLQWLAFSKSRMTVEEIAEVAAVDFEGAEGPLYDPDMRYRQPEDVLTICYGLVTEVGGTVRLAHFSVKEYIIKRLKSEAEAQGITGEQLSHSVIAQTCLARLLYFDQLSVIPWSQDTFWNSEDPIHSSLPLCRYAAVNWISHFHSASADSTHHPRLLKLLLNLFALPGTYAMICLRDLESEGDLWRERLTLNAIASPVYYACFAGLTQIVQHLINDGADINAVGGSRSTPLIAAITEGHLKLATLLLEKEADVNAEGGEYGPALFAATVGGHLKLVKLLLEKGASVNEEGANDIEGKDTPLIGAIRHSHFELTKLLLENGADLATVLVEYGADVRGHLGTTALVAAIYHNHIELATLLLENGADANAGTVGGAVLYSVSWAGHFELAKLLLEKGAHVNAVGALSGTALQAALNRDHPEIVELLLKWGADPAI
ncbi:hypothetical protein FIBSPDRAFT_1044192 [Athelia psychrophila]|uniref:Nephrocystin 3-like N-terminal domain-containing protein n=1 Tax=Athelia psychrophila TaxID=1759441 RepID=A0A166K2V7_9AGAM|nr:hypothetical protein FIBSPDRAFT_1044192 [Fibularhizoctonia sp. CBS 109695]